MLKTTVSVNNGHNMLFTLFSQNVKIFRHYAVIDLKL